MAKLATEDEVYSLHFFNGIDKFEVSQQGIHKIIKANLKQITLSYDKVHVICEGKSMVKFKSLDYALIYLHATKNTCEYFGKSLQLYLMFE